MEAIRKQASKLREQVARQQQVPFSSFALDSFSIFHFRIIIIIILLSKKS
jgi:hypothetical protein